MKVISKAVLENVVIFDKRNLSVKGLAKNAFSNFDLTDFIIKDRELVINASLVLYDNGNALKFVMSNIGMKIESYDTFRKHVQSANYAIRTDKEMINIAAKKSIVITDDAEDSIISTDVEDIIIEQTKNMETLNEQGHQADKSHKKIRTGKNNSNSSRSTGKAK